MEDGLNIKVALNSLTEHIFCIVPADYIFVRFFDFFPIKCKLPQLLASRVICKLFCERLEQHFRLEWWRERLTTWTIRGLRGGPPASEPRDGSQLLNPQVHQLADVQRAHARGKSCYKSHILLWQSHSSRNEKILCCEATSPYFKCSSSRKTRVCGHERLDFHVGINWPHHKSLTVEARPSSLRSRLKALRLIQRFLPFQTKKRAGWRNGLSDSLENLILKLSAGLTWYLKRFPSDDA